MRSRKLQSWLRAHDDVAAIKNDIDNLSAKLRKELFDEAIAYEDIRATYEKCQKQPQTKNYQDVLEKTAILAYCDKPEFLVELVFPGLNEANIPSSNIIAASGLFGVANPNADERRHFPLTKIFCQENIEVLYAGEELFTTDLDVLLALIHAGKNSLNEIIRVKPADLLKRLGWSEGDSSYEQLEAVFDCLRSATIIVRTFKDKVIRKGDAVKHTKKRECTVGVHILTECAWFKDESVSFALDPKFMVLCNFGKWLPVLEDRQKTNDRIR